MSYIKPDSQKKNAILNCWKEIKWFEKRSNS